MANPKCLPRLPWPKWAEESGLPGGFKSTDNWHAFETWAQNLIDNCMPSPVASGSLPWGMLTCYGQSVPDADVALRITQDKFDRSTDFEDWFTGDADGFTAVRDCVFQVGFSVIWHVPFSFDFPRDPGGTPFCPFGLWSGVGGDTAVHTDYDTGFSWPEAHDIFTDDVINTNTFSNAFGGVVNAYQEWMHTASSHVFLNTDHQARLFVARSRNDGSHDSTDLGGFSISASKFWIYPLYETNGSGAPLDDNFIQEYF